jgi:hypothetical protein
MHIERIHNVGKTEAVRRIDTLLDDLMRRPPPGGVTVQEVSKSWSDNILNFSFRAKKSFFGATISGAIRVGDNSVAMDCDLPGMVTTFVPEDKIRETIHRQLDRLFPAEGNHR